MDVLINNLYTIWLMVFIFNLLYIFRIGFLLVQAWVKEFKGNYNGYDLKFKLTGNDLFLFGISVAYVLTYIIWWIK